MCVEKMMSVVEISQGHITRKVAILMNNIDTSRCM